MAGAVGEQQLTVAGMDALQSRISVTRQQAEDGSNVWRVNYGPQNPVGRRGGDFLVEVNAEDASVRRVLHGQ